MSRFHLIAALAAVSLLASVTTARAHVVAEPKEVSAGYAKIAFRVSHGCNGSPTVALTLKIPEGLSSVKAQAKPGWAVTVTRRKLETPLDDGHGGNIHFAVDRVTWRGGPLADDQYDEFGLVFRARGGQGAVALRFPAHQECISGRYDWIEIPAEGQDPSKLVAPAPSVTVAPAPHKHRN